MAKKQSASDDSSESSSGSQATPIIAVEVNTDGDIRLEDHEDLENDDLLTSRSVSTPTLESDLRNLQRRICIVTTAALPWRTGTAVNPLLRALELAKARPAGFVTLYIPWLVDPKARQKLYGSDCTFETCSDQEKWIRNYCVERCNCNDDSKLSIQFYTGIFQESFGSIFPTQDICSLIPAEEADVCILEEPEHLNWFRVPAKASSSTNTSNMDATSNTASTMDSTASGTAAANDDEQLQQQRLGWRTKFRHVVGILHTNYPDYVRQYGFVLTATALNSLSSLVCKAYTHRLIRLSATLPHLDQSKEVTANVHGVRQEFLERKIGDDQEAVEVDEEETKKIAPIYFIGKLVWAKGFENVLELQEKFKVANGEYFSMDIYGGGKDQNEIQKAFFGRKHGILKKTNSVLSDSSSSGGSSAARKDGKAEAVFGHGSSLRDQICGGARCVDDGDVVDSNEDVSNSSAANNLMDDDEEDDEEREEHIEEAAAAAPEIQPTESKEADVPMEILGDLSGKTFNTTVETADAALKLLESVVTGALGPALTVGDDEKRAKKARDAVFHSAPAKTRFKVRPRVILYSLCLETH